MLKAAREITGRRLICVFGAGGDRDRGKRPLMGAIARRLADVAVVTSDNPRCEDPQAIIAEIIAGIESGPRRARPAGRDRHGAAHGAAQATGGDRRQGPRAGQEIGRGGWSPFDDREVAAASSRRPLRRPRE